MRERSSWALAAVAVLALALFAGVAGAKSSSAKRPTGVPPSAVKVDPSKFGTVEMKKLKKTTTCAELKRNRWTAGVRYKQDWFASYSYLVRYTQALLTAAEKRNAPTETALRKRLKEYRQLATYGGNACSALRRQPTACASAARGVPLRFDVSTAIGIALTAPSRQGSSSGVATTSSTCVGRQLRQATADSGIRSVLANGALRDAIVAGYAAVEYAVISPNGRLYVVFSQRVDLENSGTGIATTSGCVIAEVDRSTGVPTCIDDRMLSVNSFSGHGRTPLQFDADGGVYYTGSYAADGALCCNAATVLRRFKGGQHTLLSNQQQFINDFHVGPTGDVFLQGYTQATSTYFTRRIYATGGLANVSGQNFVTLPDGAVYANVGSCIQRFDLATNAYVAPAYLCGSSATNDWAAHCAPGGAGHSTGPCGAGGSQPSLPRRDRSYTSPSGAFYVRATNGIVRLYPSLATYTTPVQSATLISGVGDNVIVAGTNASGQQLLVRLDVATGAVTTLIDPSNGGQIEFYHLLASSDGSILFDGLRFSTNEYVIGRINAGDGSITILSTVTGRLSDFQTF